MALYAKFSHQLVKLPWLSSRLSRAHAAVYLATEGRVGRRFIGRPVLVLRTVGRRTGQRRHSPMFFVEDGGSYVVAASNGAARSTPNWFHNAKAGGAEVILGGRTVPVEVRIATDAERERLWPKLDAFYAGFADYRDLASREIPLALLTPTR